ITLDHRGSGFRTLVSAVRQRYFPPQPAIFFRRRLPECEAQTSAPSLSFDSPSFHACRGSPVKSCRRFSTEAASRTGLRPRPAALGSCMEVGERQSFAFPLVGPVLWRPKTES